MRSARHGRCGPSRRRPGRYRCHGRAGRGRCPSGRIPARTPPNRHRRARAATYCLLALLGLRSWTGYELTQQARRSLHFIWPTSEAHLYREQKKLVALGWATSETETVGQRTRRRSSISEEGRTALERWTTTEPAPPSIAVEGIVRTFFGDQGTTEALGHAMRTRAAQARGALDEFVGFIDEYLADGGTFPERLHVVTLAMEVHTDLLATLEQFFTATAAEVEQWNSTVRDDLGADTRARLERLRDRYRR